MSLRALDEVFTLAQLEKVDAGAIIDAARAELAPRGDNIADLAAQLDAVLAVLDTFDRFAQRSMGIRLTQTPGCDELPQPLRVLVTSTVTSYARNPALLHERVSGALRRSDPTTEPHITRQVMSAAERVLADRAILWNGVLGLAQKIAAERLPLAQRASRDRSLRENERARWGQARIDLQRISEQPAGLAAGNWAERLAKIPPPPDEPEPEPTVSRTSLIEVD